MLFALRMLRKGQRVLYYQEESLSDLSNLCSLVPFMHLFCKMRKTRPRGAHYCPPRLCSGMCQRRGLNSNVGVPKAVFFPGSEPHKDCCSSRISLLPFWSIVKASFSHVLFFCSFFCLKSQPFLPFSFISAGLGPAGLRV